VPSTSVYSRLDGIVSWQACVEPETQQHQNVEVRCSHTGFAVDPATLWLIADRLAVPPGQPRPFRPPSRPGLGARPDIPRRRPVHAADRRPAPAAAAVTPERLRELLGIARTEAERSGRSPDRIEVTYLGVPNSAAIEAADGAGVDRCIVMDRTVDFTREQEQLVALAETWGLPRPGRPLSPRQSLLAELPRPIRARANLEFNVLVDFMDSQV
jgi:hypothetical protein